MAATQNNRERQLCNAFDLPSPRRFWTVIVQVLRKDDVKVGKSGKNYQGYVLTDMEGTLVSVVVYEPHIGMFGRLLRPYKRYYLANAQVKDANPQYRIGPYAFSWTLSGLSHVELIEDDVPYTIPCNFNFTRFSELYRLVEHDDRIAIRCLIVHSMPINGDARTTNYVVIDEEGIPMIMHVWGDFVDNMQHRVTAQLPAPTMAVFINVKVTTHHGLSLATKTNSSVFHDPPITGASGLLEWFEANSGLVRDLVRTEAYKNTDVLLPAPTPAMITPVSTVLETIDVIKVAWVSGIVHLLPAQEKLWYTACSNCNKSVNSYITWEFTCNSCGFKAPVQQRCHVGFFLTDADNTMCITMFSPEAEMLIGYTATQLKEAYEKNISVVNEIEAAVDRKRVTCFVKYYDRTYRGNSLRTHPVLKLYLHPEEDAAPVNPDNPAIPPAPATTVGDSLLFSPTAKRILDEIEDASPQEEETAHLPVSAKRALFNTGETGSPTALSGDELTVGVTSVLPSGTVVQPSEGTSTLTLNSNTTPTPGNGKAALSKLESPIKKSKLKEKEN